MEAMAAYWPIGIRMSAWSLKCGALSEGARRMAEYASLFRLRAAQMPQSCARLAARSTHNFGGCAFIHEFCFFVKHFFHFVGDLFCWLCCPNFSMERDILCAFSTFDTPVNTCNIRLRPG